MYSDSEINYMPLSRVLFPGEEEEEEARFSFAAGGGADGGRDGRTDGGARLVVKSVTLSEQLGKEGRKEGRLVGAQWACSNLGGQK